MIQDLTIKKIIDNCQSDLKIVMPIYNEAQNINNVLSEWIKEFNDLEINYQFILINDGSKDKTLDILLSIEKSNPEKFIIINKSNSGHGRSVRIGYEYSILNSENHNSWVLQIDSDGQCSPQYFKDFWDCRYEYDYVIGFRKSRMDGFIRLLTSKICMFLSSMIFTVRLPDPNVPYRLINVKALNRALTFIPQSFDIHNVALSTILGSFKDLKYTTIDIVFLDRAGGQNSINFMNVFQLGFSMVFDLIKLKRSLKSKIDL